MLMCRTVTAVLANRLAGLVPDRCVELVAGQHRMQLISTVRARLQSLSWDPAVRKVGKRTHAAVLSDIV